MYHFINTFTTNLYHFNDLQRLHYQMKDYWIKDAYKFNKRKKIKEIETNIENYVYK